jgi:hypothetical protein
LKAKARAEIHRQIEKNREVDRRVATRFHEERMCAFPSCVEKFLPTGSRQKFCPAHSKEMRRKHDKGRGRRRVQPTVPPNEKHNASSIDLWATLGTLVSQKQVTNMRIVYGEYTITVERNLANT